MSTIAPRWVLPDGTSWDAGAFVMFPAEPAPFDAAEDARFQAAVLAAMAEPLAVADTFPLHPPARYFEKPEWLRPGQKLTIVTEGQDAGRVAGYVAPWGQCLLGGAMGCFKAPRSITGYTAAMQGQTMTAEGELLRTANIGGGVNHAPIEAGAFSQRIVDHYANTASQLMRVRYGEDDYGIYLAGAAWPGITDRDVATIRASAVSGDWRWRQEFQAYEMAGVQLVSVPGFPLLRSVTAGCSAHPILIGGMGGAPAEMLQEVTMDSTTHVHTAACSCQVTDPIAAAEAQFPGIRAAIDAMVETRVAALTAAVTPADGMAPPATSPDQAPPEAAGDPLVAEMDGRLTDVEGAVAELAERQAQLEGWIAEKAAVEADAMEAQVAAPPPREVPPTKGDEHEHYDENGDGKCDECGAPMKAEKETVAA